MDKCMKTVMIYLVFYGLSILCVAQERTDGILKLTIQREFDEAEINSSIIALFEYVSVDSCLIYYPPKAFYKNDTDVDNSLYITEKWPKNTPVSKILDTWNKKYNLNLKQMSMKGFHTVSRVDEFKTLSIGKIKALEPFENIVIDKIRLPVTKVRKVKRKIPQYELDWSNMLSPDDAAKEIAELRKKYDNFPEEYYVFWSELAKLASANDPFKRKITIRVEKKSLKNYFPYVFGQKVAFKRLMEMLAATMRLKCQVDGNAITLK